MTTMSKRLIGPIIAAVGALIFIVSPYTMWFSELGVFNLSLRTILALQDEASSSTQGGVIATALLIAGIAILIIDLAEIVLLDKGWLTLAATALFVTINIFGLTYFMRNLMASDMNYISVGMGFVLFIISLILQSVGALVNHALRFC